MIVLKNVTFAGGVPQDTVTVVLGSVIVRAACMGTVAFFPAGTCARPPDVSRGGGSVPLTLQEALYSAPLWFLTQTFPQTAYRPGGRLREAGSTVLVDTRPLFAHSWLGPRGPCAPVGPGGPVAPAGPWGPAGS